MRNKNLLIIGGGTYGVVASEIASDMGCFDKIDFLDDERSTTVHGVLVVGTTKDLEKLSVEYCNIVVAIGNSQIRRELLRKIKEETPYRIVSLVSPKAYIAPSAQIMEGCIVEPMAVVHTDCILSTGCIISAGAIVNHNSMCFEGVHVDCNGTVESGAFVPAEKSIKSGEIFTRNTTIKLEDIFGEYMSWSERAKNV